jgi:aarF domain-containing kinase
MEYCSGKSQGSTRKTFQKQVVLKLFDATGGHINDPDYLRANGIDPHYISPKISQMYAEMIFKFGYVHCDPHPGNVLVQKDENGKPLIVLLDHGLYSV